MTQKHVHLCGHPLMSPGLDRPFDVAIAGAGLAGSALAFRLANSGARVALLDPATFPRDKLCGEFLSPEAWPALDRLEVSGAIARAGYQPIKKFRLTTPRGRVIEADVIGPDGRPGIGLGRSALDDLLVRRAREAGVTVIEGARVGGPIIRDGQVVGLRARIAGSGPSEIIGSAIVAADGRHSALVRQTGSTRPRSLHRPRLFGLKRHLASSEAGPSGVVGLHLVPGGYVGTCRVDGGALNLCGLLPESAASRQRGDLDRLALDEFGQNPALAQTWAESTPIGPWKTVAGVRVETSRPRLPGILYAGDCRGTVDPLGGQGMTMALLGAELLAPFVLQALVEGGISTNLQRDYQAAWHRRFDRRVNLCRLFHHALVNPWLVDLGSTFRTLAPRILAACYDRTRDPAPASG